MATLFHLADTAPPSSLEPFNPSTVDDASDEELDALDVGVVGLDEDGTILRYNLYESRLARLDRNQVIGRNFFVDVAPCTRTDAFEGRFRRLVGSADERSSDRFPYLFDFRFGAQEVIVEIIRVPTAPRLYLLIRRVNARAPRAGVQLDQIAVAQSALAPDEALLGVRRDDVEMRVVRLPWSFLAALRSTCERLAPESWPLLCQEWGVQWGRRAAVDLESTALERYAKSLRELSMRTVAELIADELRDEGWGSTSFDFGSAQAGLIGIEVDRSALAESTRLTKPKPSNNLASPDNFACHLLAGCTGALLAHVAQRRITVREVSCASAFGRDGTKCSFVAIGHRRQKALDSAIAGGARDLQALGAALARGAGP